MKKSKEYISRGAERILNT
ncbi:MAG TPA: hypothetical protein LFV91_01935 [Rickettsia endosymbiont of Bembidion nr. Transversale]|nr:hypothetical protein [Rickettsia endosymbiont of Stiretrus anchorago]HJD65834.1 hypothetical protein [Rickettsia endosymbiont of Bembidion nr. Transversale]